jgi:hypothetical protein
MCDWIFVILDKKVGRSFSVVEAKVTSQCDSLVRGMFLFGYKRETTGTEIGIYRKKGKPQMKRAWL